MTEFDRKAKVTGEENGMKRITFQPTNCQHPNYQAGECRNAIHPAHPECDCRWCTFNIEFNKAGK